MLNLLIAWRSRNSFPFRQGIHAGKNAVNIAIFIRIILINLRMKKDCEKVVCKELKAENKEFRILMFMEKHQGKGAYGDCFMGWNPSKAQLVAIKKIYRKKQKKIIEFKQLYEKELKNLYYASKKYRIEEDSNIVNVEPILLFSEHLNHAYMVMEYCKGGSLDGLMEKFRNEGRWFTFQEVCTIIIDLLDGYHQLSSIPILHQDIKPENILINGNRFKIGDFGLSIQIGTDKVQFGGSLLYNAPQKFKHILEVKSDVYALGVVFYQLLYDSHPYFTQQDFYDYASEHWDSAKTYFQRTKLPLNLYYKFLMSRKLKQNALKVAISSSEEEQFVQLNELILSMITIDCRKRASFQEIQQKREELKIQRWQMKIPQKKIPSKYQFVIEQQSQLLGKSIHKSLKFYQEGQVPQQIKNAGKRAIRVNLMSLFLFQLVQQLQNEIETRNLENKKYDDVVDRLNSLNYCLIYHEYYDILNQIKNLSKENLKIYYQTTEDEVINNTKHIKTTLESTLGNFYHIRAISVKQFYEQSKHFLNEQILNESYFLYPENKCALKLIQIMITVIDLGHRFTVEDVEWIKREKSQEMQEIRENKITLTELSKQLCSMGIKIGMIECQEE